MEREGLEGENMEKREEEHWTKEREEASTVIIS